MKIKNVMKILALAGGLMVPAIASADLGRAPAPRTTFLIEHSIFAQGASSNLKSAMSHLLNEYYTPGACIEADGWANCDALQFGFTTYNGPPPSSVGRCPDSTYPLVWPEEDGGADVEDRIGDISRKGDIWWCDESRFDNDVERVNHDVALQETRDDRFPRGSAATDAVQDAWWDHPHLNLLIIGELPRESLADPDDRIKKTIKEACINIQGGPNKDLPAMPTWVMSSRRPADDATAFASILSAAGGTGECCYIGNPRNPTATCDPIDICEQILDGRSEATIRTELADGHYVCDGASNAFSTGLLGFEDNKKWGTLPEIECMLGGINAVGGCSSNPHANVDLFGIFSCIRQLPRGVSAADATIKYCRDVGFLDLDGDGIDDDGYDEEGCVELTEAAGDIEFIDERKTLFMIADKAQCDLLVGGDIVIDLCPLEGEFCVPTPRLPGRCSIGKYECIDYIDQCVPAYQPMPEICNGIDDDCDGAEDNITESWAKADFSDPALYTIPEEHMGKDCQVRDVCQCPNGVYDDLTLIDGGSDFLTYLDSWQGNCTCGEGLSYTPAPAEKNDMETDGTAGCSATSLSSSAPFWPLGLLLGGLFFARRRRKED